MNISKFFLCLLFFTVSVAYAGNASLKDSPMTSFTAKDWQFYHFSQDAALNSASDGTKVAWQNKDSNATGSFTPMHTEKLNGITCRILAISVTANKHTRDVTDVFCKSPDGWLAI